jgi:hypothetical protein
LLISYHNCHYLHSRFLSTCLVHMRHIDGMSDAKGWNIIPSTAKLSFAHIWMSNVPDIPLGIVSSEMKHYNLLLIISVVCHSFANSPLTLLQFHSSYLLFLCVRTSAEWISIAIFFMFHSMLKLNFTTWSIHLPLIIINFIHIFKEEKRNLFIYIFVAFETEIEGRLWENALCCTL